MCAICMYLTALVFEKTFAQTTLPVVSRAVPGLSEFYSLLLLSDKPRCATFQAHTCKARKPVMMMMMMMYFVRRHEVHSTNTLSAQRRLIKTYRTERFTTAMEADWQDYQHLLHRIFHSGVGGQATALQTRGGTGSGVPESTPEGFCVFLSARIRSQKFGKIRTRSESLFNFGRSRSLCGQYLSKNMGKLRLDRRLQPETEQESDSQIWNIAGSGLKNFGTGAESESEKVTLLQTHS